MTDTAALVAKYRTRLSGRHRIAQQTRKLQDLFSIADEKVAEAEAELAEALRDGGPIEVDGRRYYVSEMSAFGERCDIVRVETLDSTLHLEEIGRRNTPEVMP